MSDVHEFEITELLNEKYKYHCVCKCGWQARCYTMQEVEDKIGHHKMNQAYLSETGGIRGGGL